MTVRTVVLPGGITQVNIDASTANETYLLPSKWASTRRMVIRRVDSGTTYTATVTVPTGASLDGITNGTAIIPADMEVNFEAGDGEAWQTSGSLAALLAALGGSPGGGAVASVVGQTGTVTGSQILADSTVAAALAGKSTALTRTAVKMANYTAAAGEYVPVDTTSDNVTVTLPTAPADKTRVATKMVIQGGTNTLGLACGGSDVLNKAGGSTTATLTLLNQGVTLEYQSSTAIWTVINGDLPLSGLDARFARLTDLRGATDVLRSQVPLYKAAATSTYTFPLRLRPEEPTRRLMIVRNVGTTTITLGYTTNGNSNFGAPASFPITVLPGQEYIDSETVQAIHCRPNVSGEGWSAVIITELGAL